jgi:hypothetical protein
MVAACERAGFKVLKWSNVMGDLTLDLQNVGRKRSLESRLKYLKRLLDATFLKRVGPENTSPATSFWTFRLSIVLRRLFTDSPVRLPRTEIIGEAVVDD